MTRKIRLGVVGLGRVASSHLPAIEELRDKVTLQAIVSRDPEKAARAAEGWDNAKLYTTFEEAVQDPDIDAFLLLLPHDLHAPYAIQAMQAGKHVLIEKPMALNYWEGQQMVEAAEQNGVTLMVGQSRRYFAPVMKSIEKIRNGEIGELFTIHAMLLAYIDKPAVDWWKDVKHIGGFIIPLWGSHILDYIVWAYGELPETVYAQGYSHNANWDGEDEVAISLKFAGNRMANVMMSFNAGRVPGDEEGLGGTRIWSTQDSVYVRYMTGTKGILHLKDEHELWDNGEQVICPSKHGSNFTWQLEEFIDSLLEQRVPLAAGHEVLGVMRVMDAIFASMLANRVIRLDEVGLERERTHD
ncbi:Gfo/Idh/MocA family protein [Paenibacillus whitsoniae]|uniref:Gfo/Idh/MocA family oxidoreductase n=1 Tax=Paenibacillus whitsoniae TaxID=2496558 RepID=A0A430JHZ0_9BACL|nr:Gfo/Idh/MocA family oxidoreductase [Paenibacillus whitsoniae]RTE10668.1 Gfo/Idh/MocA family oxidoreductase [Paenibacillus whitsoniae]